MRELLPLVTRNIFLSLYIHCKENSPLRRKYLLHFHSSLSSKYRDFKLFFTVFRNFFKGLLTFFLECPSLIYRNYNVRLNANILVYRCFVRFFSPILTNFSCVVLRYYKERKPMLIGKELRYDMPNTEILKSKASSKRAKRVHSDSQILRFSDSQILRFSDSQILRFSGLQSSDFGLPTSVSPAKRVHSETQKLRFSETQDFNLRTSGSQLRSHQQSEYTQKLTYYTTTKLIGL